MAEQPALHRIHVIGYSANDRDFPIVALVADPRVAGYRVPEDLSACPDKRYPKHVFTGAQPLSGDERVRHVWEILPSPTVPFTRYDDDLGPVQGRRRSVKNDGQVASLAADKRVTYEAREGSAIVYTELEESWSVATDDDGNSLFPFKDRDFYDASRGPVQERRQLFVPTGEEEGSLENVNGVITQTSYEPYNEFLSVKVVQTYEVDGPQLIGRATDNEGQLITVTTQRKGADGYVPPSPTATRTVEVNREDAESLVERIVDTPEVFEGKNLSLEKPDVTPQKFRAAIPASSVETTIAGTVTDPIVLAGNEISKSEQQVTEFVKRIRATTRDPAAEATITGAKVYTSELGGGIANVTETYSSSGEITADLNTVSVSSEALGDGKFVGQKVELPIIPTLVGQDYDELLDVVFPYTQTVVPTLLTVPETLEAGVDLAPRNNLQTVKRTRDKDASREALLAFNWTFGSTVNVSLPDLLEGVVCINSISTGGGYSESELDLGFNGKWTTVTAGTYSIIGNLVYDIKEGFSGPVDANRHVFFLDRDSATLQNVINRLNTLPAYQGTMAGFKPSTTVSKNVKKWPKTKPKKHTIIVTGGTIEVQGTRLNQFGEEDNFLSNNISTNNFGSITTSENIIPPTLHEGINIGTTDVTFADLTTGNDSGPSISPADTKISVFFEDGRDTRYSLQPTEPPFFEAGNYLVSIDTEPYRFGLVRVSTVVALITKDYL
jgi:hypothetical protein